MSFGKFCPKCNAKTEAIVSGVCFDCFLKKHELFSVKDFHIDVCVKCGKLMAKGKWLPFSDEVIKLEIISRVKALSALEQPKVFVELKKEGPLSYNATVTVEGFLEGSLIKQEKEISFDLQKVSCDSCMKLVSNYREAVVQIRTKDKEEAQAIVDLLKSSLAEQKETNSLSGVTRTMQDTFGFDVWVGSKKAAGKAVRQVSKAFKLKVNVSKKLIGEEDDRTRRYRFTFCLKK